MFYLSCITVVIEFIILTLARTHYIIDLITGMIFAHYVYILVDEYIHYVDNSFLSMKDKDMNDDEERVHLRDVVE